MMTLSFIIPLYNAEEYIERCIDSIYKQELDTKDFEVIVINDGSTDNSLSIVKEMELRLTNLKVIDKENGGQGLARNIGIELALGEYIIFIDSDDYLVDSQIKPCLKKTLNNNLDVCCMGMQISQPSGKLAKKKNINFSEKEIYTGKWLLLHGYFPASVCAHFFKREFLLSSGIRFSTNIMHEDVDFHLELFSYIKRFMFCHVIVYIYYYNSNSTDRLMDINKQKRSMLSIMQTCVKLEGLCVNNNLDEDLKCFYKKVSNSQMLVLYLKLLLNNSFDTDFRQRFIQMALERGLLPIKGSCFSWKSIFFKTIVNFLHSIQILK